MPLRPEASREAGALPSTLRMVNGIDLEARDQTRGIFDHGKNLDSDSCPTTFEVVPTLEIHTRL